MEEFNVQDLLAPTWSTRAQTANRLMLAIAMGSDGSLQDPLQTQLRELKPDPRTFLSALIGFWSLVAALERQGLFGGSKSRKPVQGVGDPRFDLFPISPELSKIKFAGMNAIWVWQFIEKIGSAASLVEKELVACLEHDESTLIDAATAALARADSLSDDTFARLLAVADRLGWDHAWVERSKGLARHANGARLQLLLDGMAPDAPEARVRARAGALRYLTGDAAVAAYNHLSTRMGLAWKPQDHDQVLQAFAAICAVVGAKHEDLETIRQLATRDDESLRCGAAEFLGRHGTSSDLPLLERLLQDPSPYVRARLCQGAMERTDAPDDLLRAAASACIGNFAGHDGVPHATCAQWLLSTGPRAELAAPAWLSWWNDYVSGNEIETVEVQSIVALTELIKPETARRFLPGLRIALNQWTSEPDSEEMPALNEPGAIDVVRDRLEQDMVNAGNDPALAAAMANLHGGVLAELAGSFQEIQAEIDAHQAELDEARRQIDPDWVMESAEAPNESENDDTNPTDYGEDDRVTELRRAIEKLSQS